MITKGMKGRKDSKDGKDGKVGWALPTSLYELRKDKSAFALGATQGKLSPCPLMLTTEFEYVYECGGMVGRVLRTRLWVKHHPVRGAPGPP